MSIPRPMKSMCVALATFLALFFALPQFLLPKNLPYSFALYDKDGILLGATCASDGQWRFEPDEVPERFRIALVNFEDKRFYFHPGVDFLSIARARFQQKGGQDSFGRLDNHDADDSAFAQISEANIRPKNKGTVFGNFA